MNDSSERNWEGMTIILARLGRAMARCYTGLVYDDLAECRTVLGVRDMKDGVELLEAMFVTRRASSLEMELVVAACGPWLDRFEALWNDDHPEFQSLECLQVLERYVSGPTLSSTEFQQAGRFLLTLRAAARSELLENSDPAVREMANIGESLEDILATEGPC
jgi:hypothetical protein